MRLLELYLGIDSIIIGERFKGGTFRPSQDTIPSSTIEGALKHYFGIEVPAVGFFEEMGFLKKTATNLTSLRIPLETNFLMSQECL